MSRTWIKLETYRVIVTSFSRSSLIARTFNSLRNCHYSYGASLWHVICLLKRSHHELNNRNLTIRIKMKSSNPGISTVILHVLTLLMNAVGVQSLFLVRLDGETQEESQPSSNEIEPAGTISFARAPHRLTVLFLPIAAFTMS